MSQKDKKPTGTEVHRKAGCYLQNVLHAMGSMQPRPQVSPIQWESGSSLYTVWGFTPSAWPYPRISPWFLDFCPLTLQLSASLQAKRQGNVNPALGCSRVDFPPTSTCFCLSPEPSNNFFEFSPYFVIIICGRVLVQSSYYVSYQKSLPSEHLIHGYTSEI